MPAQQDFPAACPACGVILARAGSGPRRVQRAASQDGDDEGDTWRERLLEAPAQVTPFAFWCRVALLVGFGLWAVVLISLNYRNAEINDSFLHRPLLIFHEAGHVIFMPFGHWMTIFGGTLGQLLMPAIMGGALLWTNRDPFGAAIGLWLLGVSVLDVAPYVYDSLVPQMMLLSGRTGEAGGHDWIYLLRSMGLLPQAQWLGALVHKLGAGVILLALVWAAMVLKRQHARVER
jgi:hypothetical protein